LAPENELNQLKDDRAFQGCDDLSVDMPPIEDGFNCIRIDTDVRDFDDLSVDTPPIHCMKDHDKSSSLPIDRDIPSCKEAVTEKAAYETEATKLNDNFTVSSKILDAQLEQFDNDNALRSVIIAVDSEWVREKDKAFETNLEDKAGFARYGNRKEKNSAFDLLDAISRGGMLAIEYSELHVVGFSHSFENDVMYVERS